MKNKNDSSTVYYGIYDTKLTKVIFNTDEKLNYYMPFSDREMLAVTDSSVYKICAIKDENNNGCVDYCENNYLLYTQGNKCNKTIECKPGEVMLAPIMVCNQTCDENIYHWNGTHCGLCSYFNGYLNFGNIYKLIGVKGCIGQKEDNSMEYYNERLNLLKCKEGYILQGQKCEKKVTCYERCETCSGEPDSIYSQKCTSCKSPYLLENDNCVENCSPNYYRKSDDKCECCHDDQCNKFEQNTCICLKCEHHYFVNSNKKCELCSVNCNDCNETSTNCTSCIGDNSFLYNNTCYACEDNSKCKNFFEKGCECEKCKDGFYNLNHQCKSCVNDCKTCSNSSECEICQDNYFLDSTGQCSECPKTCAIKKSDNCQCETCIEGYFMNSSEKCQECDTTKCKKCEGNADNCTQCKENYFFDELKKCEQCDEKCKTCSKEKTNCTSCDDGFFLTKENKCDKCDSKCLTCSDGGESECLSCNTSDEYKYYLIYDDYNKTCVKDCSKSGRELDEINFECKPLRKNNGTDENKQPQKSSADYILWIFIVIFGVLLIIITICIIKTCCCNKTSGIEEEISQEFTDKSEIIA